MRLSAFLAFGALLLAGFAAHANASRVPSGEIHIAALYPEGPLWQGDQLYFAEMGGDRVSVWRNGERRTFFSQRGCGPTALAPYGDGFLVLCHIGARVVAVDANGRAVRTWERGEDGRHLQDPNDAFADGRGGVYFSDPGNFSRDARVTGAVMYLSADGALRRVAGPLWYPNGVVVDPAHRTLYVNEHMEGRVLKFDIAADGALSNQRVFVDLTAQVARYQPSPAYPEAGPDGIEFAPNGDLFVALYGEGKILRLSPQGQVLGVLSTPGAYVTNMSVGPGGQLATTASFENLRPPFPGEVRIFPASRLTPPPE